MMKYFRKLENGEVFAYNDEDPAQAAMIEEKLNDEEFQLLEVWPPPRTLDMEKQAKAAEINNTCHVKIISGFPSDTLGEVHTYPSKDTDQLNLSGSVIASLYPDLPVDWLTPFWCADSNNDWQMRPHTAEQIQKVGSDFVVFKLRNMAHNDNLQQQIAAATTVDEVRAIEWTL